MTDIQHHQSRMLIATRPATAFIAALVLAACMSPAAPTPPPATIKAATPTIVQTATHLPPTPTGLPPPDETSQPSPTPAPSETATLPACPGLGCAPTGPPPAGEIATPMTLLTLPANLKLPQAEIRITRPGQLSRVTSPFWMEASAIPGPDGVLNVELIGEDGALLMRQVLGYITQPGQRVSLAVKVEFEIPGVAQAARLQIYAVDGYGHTRDLSSVSLILLTQGETDPNPVIDILAPYAITSPKENQYIKGGTLTVSGLIRPVTDKPIAFELYANSGESVGSRVIKITPAPDGSHVPFQTDIPYQVTSPAWARLIIHQADKRIPGNVAVASMRLYLQP